MTQINGQNLSLNEVREELLDEIRNQELRLNSPEIQFAFEKESDPAKKTSFINERDELTTVRLKLEDVILTKIEARLKLLEPDLKDGLKNLDVALQNVNNTVEILNAIKAVTGLVARIVMIV